MNPSSETATQTTPRVAPPSPSGGTEYDHTVTVSPGNNVSPSQRLRKFRIVTPEEMQGEQRNHGSPTHSWPSSDSQVAPPLPPTPAERREEIRRKESNIVNEDETTEVVFESTANNHSSEIEDSRQEQEVNTEFESGKQYATTQEENEESTGKLPSIMYDTIEIEEIHEFTAQDAEKELKRERQQVVPVSAQERGNVGNLDGSYASFYLPHSDQFVIFDSEFPEERKATEEVVPEEYDASRDISKSSFTIPESNPEPVLERRLSSASVKSNQSITVSSATPSSHGSRKSPGKEPTTAIESDR